MNKGKHEFRTFVFYGGYKLYNKECYLKEENKIYTYASGFKMAKRNFCYQLKMIHGLIGNVPCTLIDDIKELKEENEQRKSESKPKKPEPNGEQLQIKF